MTTVCAHHRAELDAGRMTVHYCEACTLQARLAEAERLLRDIESRAHDNAGELDPEDYVHGGLIRIRDDARAFLARLDGGAK